jgi:hypothetical protein
VALVVLCAATIAIGPPAPVEIRNTRGDAIAGRSKEPDIDNDPR